MKPTRSTAARAVRPADAAKAPARRRAAAPPPIDAPVAKARPIATVKRKLSMQLLANPCVSGVGIEHDPDGGSRIKVYLAEDVGDAEWIPRQAGGYPVVTEYVGPIKAFDAE
jgi:hypothetical protein